MWEKEGAEDGAEGFLSRRWGKNVMDKGIACVEGVTAETKRDSYWKKDNKKNGSDNGGEEENGKLRSFLKKLARDSLID